MWNLFRKKPAEPVSEMSITVATPLDRADAILSGMDQTIPNGHAQILIALSNMNPMYSALRDKFRDGTTEFTRDDFVRQIEKMLAENMDDEIQKRRLMWYLGAAFIYSLEDGRGDPDVEDRLVQIYIRLADASEFIVSSLEHNILWADWEKSSFPDKSMANRTAIMQLYMPGPLRKHPRAQAYAKQHDFWLSRI